MARRTPTKYKAGDFVVLILPQFKKWHGIYKVASVKHGNCWLRLFNEGDVSAVEDSWVRPLNKLEKALK